MALYLLSLAASIRASLTVSTQCVYGDSPSCGYALAVPSSDAVPPSPPGLPFAGHAFALSGDVGAFLTRQHRRLGPVFRVRAFGRRFTVIAGPEANLFVTRSGARHLRSHESWSDFDAELGAGRSLVSMDGPEHIRMRSAHQPGYSRSVIQSRLDDVVAITRREIAAWPLGRPVPALAALQRIVTEQLGVLAAGVSPAECLDDLTVFVRTLVAARVTRQRPAFLTRLPRFRRARRRIEELFARVRAAHDPARRSGVPRDLVDDLLALHAVDPTFLPETDLFPALVGPFLAGVDTLGGTTAFMLYALLTHPDLLARMRVEVDEAFVDGVLTVDAVGRLDVTHRVALETLRLYPIAPALMRTVTNAFDFGGYTIPAGERVIVGTTVSHHLAQCFPDPARFDIDRYLPERREHRRPGAFAPFGVGPHVCLGAGFAEVAILATMATIVRDVDLVLDPPGYRLRTRPVPTPHPDDRFRFRVAARRQLDSSAPL